MKKYKQLYKYSDCVITNLHIIQHTRWTFSLFISLQCISPNGRLKKTSCIIFYVSCFVCCSQHTRGTKKLGWTVGSGQDGVMMSCFDRILEGHNHDVIAFQKQKRTLQDASRTNGDHHLFFFFFYAYKTSLKTQSEQTLLFKWYATIDTRLPNTNARPQCSLDKFTSGPAGGPSPKTFRSKTSIKQKCLLPTLSRVNVWRTKRWLEFHIKNVKKSIYKNKNNKFDNCCIKICIRRHAIHQTGQITGSFDHMTGFSKVIPPKNTRKEEEEEEQHGGNDERLQTNNPMFTLWYQEEEEQ